MTDTRFDEERFNQDIRRFLKKVGITSQREIEKAVRAAWEEGRLEGRDSVTARVVLEVADVNVKITVDDEIRWRE